MVAPLPQFSTRDQWITQQNKWPLKQMHEGEGTLHTTTDGLLLITLREGENPKTIVPPNLQIPLAEWLAAPKYVSRGIAENPVNSQKEVSLETNEAHVPTRNRHMRTL